MELIESAMAFAVVMIIFSTIVTGIVEFIFKFFCVREKNLRNTLDALFLKVVWPRLKDSIAPEDESEWGSVNTKTMQNFMDGMLGNPVTAAPPTNFIMKLIYKLPSFRQKQIDNLSPLAFAERLGRTDVGAAILAEGDEQLDLLVTDMTRSFERYGKAAGEVYRKQAHLASIVVGISLAIFVNIDAGRVFNALLENPDIRGGLIAQAKDAADQNEKAAKTLEAIIEKIEKGETVDLKDGELQKQAQEIEKSINALKGQGLPIGHDYYPWGSKVQDSQLAMGAEAGSDGVAKSGKPKGLDPKAASVAENEATRDSSDIDRPDSIISDFFTGAPKFLLWLLMCVLSGLLIGLGGPFWYKAFSSLSQILQLLKAFGVGDKPTNKTKDGDKDSKPDPAQSAAPQSIKDAFEVAAKSHTHHSSTRTRAILGPGGQSI